MLENRRTDKEMMRLILEMAENDERIRAVILNGSRANSMVPTDMFQDFDIIYAVTEIESFLKDRSWLPAFGKMVVLQEPDDPELFPEEETSESTYAFLMQFEDGNRIDLTLQTVEKTIETYGSDSLTIPLLDKDHILKEIPDPNDDDYHVKRPEWGEYLGCRNEFYWVSAYAAKGLYRREILYAMDHVNLYIRPQLLKMLSWEAGFLTGFSVSVGKNYKYLDKYLPKNRWEELLKTYPRADSEEIWEALTGMMELFEKTSEAVFEAADFQWKEEDSNHFGQYDRKTEGIRMKAYLKAVRDLGRPKGFRLVGFDLDGTLLNHKKEITEETKEAIAECIAQGVCVVPSTGRPEIGLPDCLMELPGILYALTSNGARVVNTKTGEVVYSDCMDKESVFCVLDETENRNLNAELYSGGCVYVEEERYKEQLETIYTGEMKEYIRRTRTPVTNLRKWLEERSCGIEKINIVCRNQVLRKELWQIFGRMHSLELTNSMEDNIELNHLSANKGNALIALGKQLGIDREEIIAFGDSGNDLMMLRTVGFGVAMGNAAPEIKAAANYVTASNKEDGVAKAIRTFVLS